MVNSFERSEQELIEIIKSAKKTLADRIPLSENGKKSLI
jgi:hypothetical protein